jgi:threonine synthase
MHANGHTTVWGTHIGVGRPHNVKAWIQELKERWGAYKAVRQEAREATLRSSWNAKREAVRPHQAVAAVDLLASTHAFSTTTTLCDLAL